MKIKDVKFITSAFDVKGFPGGIFPEIAFAGKSNVGKSSLINTMLNRKGIAKTSSTPGKTISINFFLVNSNTHFVDLPGYGFAKRSKSMQDSWKVLIENYLGTRENLKAVILLIDIRHPSELDLMLAEWLNIRKIPTLLVATKSDKLPFSKKMKHKREIAAKFNTDNKNIILFSSKNGEGKEELFKKIDTFLT